jgi:hypothetical protein
MVFFALPSPSPNLHFKAVIEFLSAPNIWWSAPTRVPHLTCCKHMLHMFNVDVAKVDRDVAYVASVSEACCKRLFKMFHLFLDIFMQAFFIWMLHMFHTWKKYVLIASVVSVLCCKFLVFYPYVAYVSNTYFKCIFQMFHLLQTYFAFKCFMF